MRKILVYIVYGEDQSYYDGAIFSFLTFMNWLTIDNPVEIVILTEKPHMFDNYPVVTYDISPQQKYDWSLKGLYHFRIKNRGLAYIMDKLEMSWNDKILFMDTDTYFKKSPLHLFELIKNNQALMYLNEGLIYKRDRFSIYIEHLEGKKIEIDNEVYELTKDSALWGSLMIGITYEMRSTLDNADKLLKILFNMVPVHTIEEFALCETILKKYRLVEGKKFVNLYSTSRKKAYSQKKISDFFKTNATLKLDEQVRLAQKVKIRRPLLVVLKQRFLSKLKR